MTQSGLMSLTLSVGAITDGLKARVAVGVREAMEPAIVQPGTLTLRSLNRSLNSCPHHIVGCHSFLTKQIKCQTCSNCCVLASHFPFSIIIHPVHRTGRRANSR